LPHAHPHCYDMLEEFRVSKSRGVRKVVGSEPDSVAYRVNPAIHLRKTMSDVYPDGLPSDYSVIATFKVTKDTAKRSWNLWQVSDPDGREQVGLRFQGDTRSLDFFYTSPHGTQMLRTFHRVDKLFDGEWHKLALQVKADKVKLLVDCEEVSVEPIGDPRPVIRQGYTSIVKRAVGDRSASVDLQQMDVSCDPEKAYSEGCCELSSVCGGHAEIGLTAGRATCKCMHGQPGNQGPPGPKVTTKPITLPITFPFKKKESSPSAKCKTCFSLQGPRGYKGSAAKPGRPGFIGPPGPVGHVGVAGRPGPKVGDAGVQGPHGGRGKRGPGGEPGRTGPVGTKGVRGDGGPVGFQGPPGPPGPTLSAQHVIEVCKRVVLEQMSTFANSVKRTCAAVCPLYGDVPLGAPGPSGQKGPPGPPGGDGIAGVNGEIGQPGFYGEVGDAGQQGHHSLPTENEYAFPLLYPPGQRGRPGRAFNGTPGQEGERGHVGRPGLRGHPGLRGVPGVCQTTGCALLNNNTTNGSPQNAPQRLRRHP
uniref:Thrombospondin-like N-terminal domain-containing protein n=1 Tax=Oncorhynchus tshawytscha TaxID=74940 RepID=A0A8C8LKT8_ONCTS